MTTNSLVSVVIPTYERPEFLRGAIETAICQTYNNIEIIVVDDGSETNYANRIVKKYPEHVTLCEHDSNRGLSAARNTGISEASGEYIAFLDDDDRWHKMKLSQQVESIDRHDGAGLTTCLVVAVSPAHEIIHCETTAPSGDCSREILIRNIIGTPSRVLVRRDVFDDIGTFDSSLPTKQDWDFYLRLAQNWEIAAVEDHLCFRTVHESMSSSPLSVKRDKNRILKKHEHLIRTNDVLEQTQAAIAEEVGRSYLGQDELKKARQFIRQALSCPTNRRRALFLFSFSHPTVVNAAVLLKRRLLLRLSGCSDLQLTREEIPGLKE